MARYAQISHVCQVCTPIALIGNWPVPHQPYEPYGMGFLTNMIFCTDLDISFNLNSNIFLEMDPHPMEWDLDK